ncbi:MAG TPA: hypothetical protein VGK67_00865 [Myxococcales bacterium]|jgi:hypothetical protein
MAAAPKPPRPPQRGSLRSWRAKFKTAVKDGFLVRFHMALILSGVTLVGMFANKLLFRLGVATMEARYPVAVLAAYLAFFAGVWMWIAYVQSTAPRHLLEPALAAPMVAAALAVDRGRPRPGANVLENLDLEDALDVADGAGDVADGLGSIGEAAGSADDGMAYVLIALLVLAIVVAAGWLVWQAPAILSEAAFSATLAGALRKAARDEDGPHWAWHVFKKSVLPFAVVALVAAGIGFGLRVVCPQARTLRGALHCDKNTAELLAD